MNKDINPEKLKRMKNFISVLSSLFSHEEANSRLIRHFPVCHDIKHKTDCIITILNSALEAPELFYSKIAVIIRLHSKAMKNQPKLLDALNTELRLIGVYYAPEEFKLKGLKDFEPYLHFESYFKTEVQYLPDAFYGNLLKEINWCYNTRAYSATIVMIRKLFENFVLDLLRKKFQQDPTKRGIYWKETGFLSFYELIQNLNTHLQDFVPYSNAMTSKTIQFLDKIRHQGNEAGPYH